MQSPAFGLLLKRYRRAAGMTQEDLAERAGMSGRAIGDLERGVRLPRRDTVRLLLEALALGPDEESRLEAAARSRISFASTSGSPLHTGSFLGALPPGRLVRRQRVVRRLLATIDATIGESGHLVLLTGEPGIGKTRLAQESALEAGRRGFLVATGRCYEPEQDVPFHPFLEALAAVYAAVPRSIREDIPRRWPYLVGLLPEDVVELPARAPSPWTGGLEGQQRLFRAVSSFLCAVAEETPVAVLLDDLHWADDASLKLLLHLARRTRSSRILLLGTYRDVEVDARHPLERALVDLNRERLVERVVVHRLDLNGTTELIDEALGGEVAVWPELAAMVHDATNGNPFFIQEILHTLVERGDLYQLDGSWHRRDIQKIRPPETVRAAIQQRISRLPAVVDSALHEASILGQAFAFDDLLALGNHAEEELDEALEAAVGAGLLREAGPGHHAFNHALTQQVLYADLPSRRRQRLHLAAGEALQLLPERLRERRVAELAWHFRAGGNVEAAVTYAIFAGDRAEAAYAYEDAQRHFRNAVEFASAPEWEPSNSSPRSTALSKLGRALNIGERYDEALEVLEQVADLHRSQGDRDSEALSVAEIGWIHHNRRTDEQGIARIQPMIATLEGEPPSVRRGRVLAALHTALARLFFGLGRYQDELSAGECAVAAARKVGDDVVLAVAETRRGAALMSLGRRDEAREALGEAVALAEATGNLGTLSVALDNLGQIARDSGDYNLSRSHFERAAAVAEQTGLPGRMGWTLIKLGRILLLLGEWQAARAVFERSAQLLGDDARSALYPRVQLAQLDVLEGKSARAVAELEAAMDAADRGRDQWLLRRGQRILAEHDLLTGRPDAALDRLTTLLYEQGTDEPQAMLLFAPLAWTYCELNREADAEQALADGMARAQRSHAVAEADLLRIKGMLRSRQGCWQEARQALGVAIDATQRMADPYREAQSRAEMGLLETRMGDLAAAGEQLDAALSIARGIGALPCARYITRLVLPAPAS
ncbi:MAG: AAA family ATPase [Chloroflexota bacterium]|nr:AAA family ATPase [Chloroflexota bacterium]